MYRDNIFSISYHFLFGQNSTNKIMADKELHQIKLDDSNIAPEVRQVVGAAAVQQDVYTMRLQILSMGRS